MPSYENSNHTFYADAAKQLNECVRHLVESGQPEPMQPLPADWWDKMHEQVENLTEEEKSHIESKFGEAVDHLIALAPRIIPGIKITKGDNLQ